VDSSVCDGYDYDDYYKYDYYYDDYYDDYGATAASEVESDVSMFVLSSTQKILGYNHNEGKQRFETVSDEVCGKASWGADFIFFDQYTMLLTDAYNNRVRIVDVNGTELGSFANMTEPMDITRLSDDKIVVSTRIDGIFVYEAENVFNPKLVSSFPTEIDCKAYNSIYGWDHQIAEGSNSEEIWMIHKDTHIIVYDISNGGEIRRIETSQTRSKYDFSQAFLLTIPSEGPEGIFFMRKGSEVIKCSMAVDSTSACDELPFYAYDNGYYFADLEYDPISRVLFVADYAYSQIHYWHIDSPEPTLSSFSCKVGSLNDIVATAIRPGFFAKKSEVDSVKGRVTAGEKIRLHLNMKDASGQEINATGLNHQDHFSVSATLEEGGDVLFVGGKLVAEGNKLVAEYVIKKAGVGNWTLSVEEGSSERNARINQHLVNSPQSFKVEADLENPIMELIQPRVITNSEAYVSIRFKDQYDNEIPWNNIGSTIKYRWDFEAESETRLAAHVEVGGDGDDASTVNLFNFAISNDEYDGEYFLHVYDHDIELSQSPVRIVKTGAPSTYSAVTRVVIAATVTLLLLLFVFQKVRRKDLASLRGLKDENHNLKSENSQLHLKNDNLNASLRKIKHSEAELEVLRGAIDQMSAEKQDELRGVLISSEDISLGKLLGKGGFGLVNIGVYHDTKNNTKMEVAVKTLIQVDEENVERFRRECFLMKSISHPYVVSLVGVVWDNSMLACCLEYVSGGDLKVALDDDWDREKKVLSWNTHLLKTASELANALAYLHNMRYYDEKEETYKQCIIHRDVKPSNMLLTKDWVLKLTDFGEARAISQEMTQVGTPIYIAPEIFKGERYTSKADVYSFGILLISLMRCSKNLSDFFVDGLRRSQRRRNKKGIGINILSNKMHLAGWRPILPKALYSSLKLMIHDCWQADPEKRPTSEILMSQLSTMIRDEVSSLPEPHFFYNDDDFDMSQDEDFVRSVASRKMLNDPPDGATGRTSFKNSGDTVTDDSSKLKAEHEALIAENEEVLKLVEKLEDELKKEKEKAKNLAMRGNKKAELLVNMVGDGMETIGRGYRPTRDFKNLMVGLSGTVGLRRNSAVAPTEGGGGMDETGESVKGNLPPSLAILMKGR